MLVHAALLASVWWLLSLLGVRGQELRLLRQQLLGLPRRKLIHAALLMTGWRLSLRLLIGVRERGVILLCCPQWLPRRSLLCALLLQQHLRFWLRGLSLPVLLLL